MSRNGVAKRMKQGGISMLNRSNLPTISMDSIGALPTPFALLAAHFVSLVRLAIYTETAYRLLTRGWVRGQQSFDSLMVI